MTKRIETEVDPFPLSTMRSIDGTRRLAREKVVQMLAASDDPAADYNAVFSHIFFRDFNLGETEHEVQGRPLRQDEIMELEADVPIKWREKDVLFARTLYRNTLASIKALDDRIERLARNWDLERIALIDRQLLRMAISEMQSFDDIAPKISINEAIELAKVYSTEKSSVFINGILDAARDELIAEGILASEAKQAEASLT